VETAPKKKVLVVEDDEEVTRLVVELLKPMGVEVLTAADGVEGTGRAAIEKPNLILVDLMMPRMGGLELIRTLKGDRRYAQLPIIVLTGNASAESVKEAAKLGVVDFLLKANLLAGTGLDRVRRALGVPEEKPQRGSTS
jgi:CheY-like chemotaxis protein